MYIQNYMIQIDNLIGKQLHTWILQKHETTSSMNNLVKLPYYGIVSYRHQFGITKTSNSKDYV